LSEIRPASSDEPSASTKRRRSKAQKLEADEGQIWAPIDTVVGALAGDAVLLAPVSAQIPC
jgi:hypothetical protein